MNILHFDCVGGASGDMIVAAMIHLGLSIDTLRKELGSLAIDSYQIGTKSVSVNGMETTRFVVEVEESRQQYRHLSDIEKLIGNSQLSDQVKQQSIDVFRRLAQAEAKVHGVVPEKVHFHEVGAVDSIVDIVSAVIGITCFSPDVVTVGRIPLGSGTIEIEHGTVPLPAPATLELLKGFDVRLTQMPHEMVTPTGAALLSSFVTPGSVSALGASFSLGSIGYGSGSRSQGMYPNILRLIRGHSHEVFLADEVVLLETNIDDMNPQICDAVMAELFRKGALDVYFSHVHMKKNRPGLVVCVLAPPDAVGTLLECVFRNTTTLGVRVQPIKRALLGRQEVVFESSLGAVRFKRRMLGGQVIGSTPEYDDIVAIAQHRSMTVQETYQLVQKEYLLQEGT